MLHTIKRDTVELAVSDSSITDTGEVHDSGSGRLSILVVHEGALLQRSDSGGEDELVIPIPIPLRRVVKEGSIVMWKRFEENTRGVGEGGRVAVATVSGRVLVCMTYHWRGNILYPAQPSQNTETEQHR